MKPHRPISAVRPRQPRVLIVDDNPANVLLLSKILAGIGAVAFPKGETPILAAMREHRPDMVLLDVDPSKMKCFEVFDAIKQNEEWREVPVIFVTARNDMEGEIRGTEAGAADFITKPFNPLLVRARLRAHLALKLKSDAVEGGPSPRFWEEQFLDLFQNVGDGDFIGDAEGRLVDVNARGSVMMGYSKEELCGMKVSEIHVEHEQGRAPASREGQDAGSNAISESLFLRKDGSKLRDEVNAQLLMDGHFRGVVRDITEREPMQDPLEDKKELLRHFIENAPAAIAMFDSAMRYLAASRHYMEDYRISETNLIGRSHYEVFPELADRWKDMHRRALEGETIQCEEESYVRSDGCTEWLRWEMAPWYSGGEIGGLLLFIENITERKEAEERERSLTNLYRALSALHEAVAHSSNESMLLRLVCQIVVEVGGLNTAWVGIPDAEGRFVPAAIFGKASGFVQIMTAMESNEAQEGIASLRMAFHEGCPVTMHHLEDSEQAKPWTESARQYGIQSAVALPLRHSGKPYGVLALYCDRFKTVEDEFLLLTEEMSAIVGFALDNISREAARQQAKAALRESEERFRRLFEDIDIAVQGYDRERRVIYWNQASERLYGYAKEEALGQKLEELIIPPAMRDKMVRAVDEWVTLGRAISASELVLMHKDGGPVPVYSSFVMQVNGAGEPEMYCIDIDMADLKKAEENMLLAAMVYRESSEGMMIMDAEGKVLSVNPAFERITGYSADDVVGHQNGILMSDQHGEELFEEIRKALGDKGSWHGELWNRRKNGELYAATLSINTSYNEDGRTHRQVVFFSDVTTKKRSEEMLWHQANFDALTDLPNRNLFLDHLSQEIRKARRAGQKFALMFLDLDGFKYVNDSLGHDMGDLLLKEAAERLQNCVRESDIVARLGGDEFTVILPELQDPGSVERVACAILQKLAEPVRLGDEIVYVSASIGITLYPEDADELEGLLKNADQAMYAAKHEGRNRYHYFTPFMQEVAQLRMRMVSDLRGALDGSQFEVVYQPIVELSSGIIHKAEALIRWRHPTRGLINPLEFIPLAEDTGMIISFGNWIFHEAARQAAKWREQYHPAFQISVNISPMQFRNEGINSTVWFQHLKQLGLPAQGVVVEITEGLLLDATSNVTEQLLAFRDAGIEVALDDFGVGYSSLSYLKKFDIDYLKIDQTFVRNLTASSDDLALCEAIIVMAHKLGIKVVAEGVETAEQRNLLTEAECDYAQGYFFTSPVPASQFEQLLATDPFAYQNSLL